MGSAVDLIETGGMDAALASKTTKPAEATKSHPGQGKTNKTVARPDVEHANLKRCVLADRAFAVMGKPAAAGDGETEAEPFLQAACDDGGIDLDVLACEDGGIDLDVLACEDVGIDLDVLA